MEFYQFIFIVCTVLSFLLFFLRIFRGPNLFPICSVNRIQYFISSGSNLLNQVLIKINGCRCMASWSKLFDQDFKKNVCFPITLGLLVGIFVAFVLNFSEYFTTRHGITKSSTSSAPAAKVWFVMPTEPSLKYQEPALVRIAQALYPSRDFITWVIICDDTTVTRHRDRYLKHLDSIIHRFSIPYVLLSLTSISLNYSDARLNDFMRQFQRNEEIARQIGLFWLKQNAQSGVVLVGSEHFTYHNKLFQEIRYTNSISVWPVELETRQEIRSSMNQASFWQNIFGSSPSKSTCDFPIRKDFRISLSGVAANIGYLKNNLNMEELWKLGTESQHYISSLGIKLSSVEVLTHCAKTYVWRTRQFRRALKKRIKLKKSIRKTNVEYLLRTIYRDKFEAYFYWDTSLKKRATNQL